MYQSYFGKLGQLRFPTPEDYYRFLGYLAKADVDVVYEYNEDTGSWGNAGRICFLAISTIVKASMLTSLQ